MSKKECSPRDARTREAKAMGDGGVEQLECDLVMRGGITSGIVYPKAVAALSKRYRFRSIGGTSAGAIAAAVTAAAEFGRRSGRNPASFAEVVAKIPEQLGKETQTGRSFLFHLFTPERAVAPLFNFVFALVAAGQGEPDVDAGSPVKPPSKWRKRGLLFAAFDRQFQILLTFGIALFAVLAVGLLAGLEIWASALVAVPTSLLITLVVVGLRISRWSRNQIAALRTNNFSTCSGLADSAAQLGTGTPPLGTAGAVVPGLTAWIDGLIQAAAGLKPDDPPLTFGDLWRASECGPARGCDLCAKEKSADDFDRKSRDVELVLMTTDLTRGLSARLPFLQSPTPLYFREKELKRLLPARVVQWMKERSPGQPLPSEEGEPFYRLPEPRDLPILLGARMSMSFPFLLSAVNFYARRERRGEKMMLVPIWFSDGGITSNFPIHFFDSPLPTRPTFCINLVPWEQTLAAQAAPTVDDDKGTTDTIVGEEGFDGHDDARRSSMHAADQREFVWMPRGNSAIATLINRFDHEKTPPLSALGGFFFAIFDTARLWGDNELMRMPGYRERIVHVAMKSQEGGLNLDMPETIIKDIAERGELAGALIGATFDPKCTSDPLRRGITHGFANHRWIRFRTFMAAQESIGEQFARAIAKWDEASPSLDDMIDGKDEIVDGKPVRQIGAKLVPAQRGYVRDETKRFRELMTNWARAKWQDGFHAFDRDVKDGRSPRPKPTLNLRPPGGNDPGVKSPP
jgi:predicted acylesterase/phospholipase RssA